MKVGGQCHAPATLPPGKTQYPLYRRLGGPQSQSGWVQKISPPPEFDPRIIHPLASRYTDCALLAHRTGGAGQKIVPRITLTGYVHSFGSHMFEHCVHVHIIFTGCVHSLVHMCLENPH